MAKRWQGGTLGETDVLSTLSRPVWNSLQVMVRGTRQSSLGTRHPAVGTRQWVARYPVTRHSFRGLGTSLGDSALHSELGTTFRHCTRQLGTRQWVTRYPATRHSTLELGRAPGISAALLTGMTRWHRRLKDVRAVPGGGPRWSPRRRSRPTL